MLVREIMTLNPKSLSPDNTLQDAAQIMHQNAFSCIPIVEHGKGIGLLTERDVVALIATEAHVEGRSLENTLFTRLEHCLFTDPVSLSESTSLLEALLIAREQKVRHLLVTDDQQKLVGVVTQSDLTAAYEEILQHQQELQVRNFKLERLSYEDELMEIGNRRAMEKDLELADSLFSRYQRPYAVALIDVDFFKNYNDHYGHLAGDAVLYKIASTLKSKLRGTDKLYRYGGEELLLIIHDSEKCELGVVVEKMRRAVEELQLPHDKSPISHVSVSIGIANVDASGWNAGVEKADSALYKAKENGRNKSVMYSACEQYGQTG